MGQAISNSCCKNYRAKIVILGLDSSGKTTILYRLKLNELVTTVPTIGFNSETLNYKNIQFSVWDVGGKEEVRRFWEHYVDKAIGIVFVVDSTDVSRMSQAAEELGAVLALQELRSAVVLVLANKQDLPGAIGPEEVAARLDLSNVTQMWFVQPTENINGNGLQAGLEWMAETLLKYRLKSDSCPYRLPCICL